MLIKSLEYRDTTNGWRLAPSKLEPFNLLVGKSAAGKSMILRALRRVVARAVHRRPSDQSERTQRGESWTIEFEQADQHYSWAYESQLESGTSDAIEDGSGRVVVTSEVVLRNGTEILRRDPENIVFQGKSVPRLTRSQSAVVLIEEPDLDPIRAGFNSILMSEAEAGAADLSTLEFTSPKNLDRWRKQYSSEQEILAAHHIPVLAKIFLLSQVKSERFQRVIEAFSEMFPITDVQVRILTKDEVEQRFPFSLHAEVLDYFVEESNVAKQLSSVELSSGMRKALMHLFELAASPPGTVFCIDEFENGLGVNCLGDAMQFLLESAPDFQFIITSHHPYIINQIPSTNWQLVSRSGSVVSVRPARESRAFADASNLDLFTRLLNAQDSF